MARAPHSMLSIGAAAFLEDQTLVSTFSANLELLPGAAGDAKSTKEAEYGLVCMTPIRRKSATNGACSKSAKATANYGGRPWRRRAKR
jgi:hypothetical protein